MKNKIILILVLISSISIYGQTIDNNLYQQRDISGRWFWNFDNGKHTSEIVLNSTDNINYSGFYCSVYYNGKTIDCGEESEVCISVKRISANTFIGTFTSPTYDGQGSIKMTLIPNEDKLLLEVTYGSKEYYLPNNAKYQQ
jgi:hypothetical protein